MTDRPAPPPQEPTPTPLPPPIEPVTTPAVPASSPVAVPWYRTPTGISGLLMGIASIVLVVVAIVLSGGSTGETDAGPAATYTDSSIDSTIVPTTTTSSAATSPATIPLSVTVTVEVDGSGDYLDLASAARAVAPGSTISLGAGTHYLTDSLALQGDLTLSGADRVHTRVLSESGPVVHHTGGSLTMSGISFEYTGAGGASVVELTDTVFVITDVSFRGGVWDEVDGSDVGEGLSVWGASSGTVAESTAVGNRRGFAFHNTSQVAISDSISDGNGEYGFYWDGDSLGTASDSNATRNGWEGFRTADGTAVDLFRCSSSENEFGMIVNDESRVTMEGMVLSANRKSGLSAQEDSTVTITDSTATGNGESGFVSFGQAAVTVTGSSSIGNTLQGFAVGDSSMATITRSAAIDNLASGFLCWHTSSGSIADSESTGNGRSGIMAMEECELVVRSTTVGSNLGAGITFGDAATGRITANTVFDNGLHGILVQGTSSPVIRTNILSGHPGGGIAVLSLGPVEIRKNEAYGNYWGIAVSELVVDAVIGNNDLHDNTVDLGTDLSVAESDGS